LQVAIFFVVVNNTRDGQRFQRRANPTLLERTPLAVTFRRPLAGEKRHQLAGLAHVHRPDNDAFGLTSDIAFINQN
jgi:hypothetical protein